MHCLVDSLVDKKQCMHMCIQTVDRLAFHADPYRLKRILQDSVDEATQYVSMLLV